jgi:hypothetical protein
VSTAELFIEAIDTMHDLGWALLVWIILVSAVVGLILYAITIVAWFTGRAVVRACRMLCARLRGELPPDGAPEPGDAPDAPQRRSRPTPRWARTTTHDDEWDEAA